MARSVKKGPFVLAIAATLTIFVAMYLLIPALPPWAAAGLNVFPWAAY